jgi:hypothetical protein
MDKWPSKTCSKSQTIVFKISPKLLMPKRNHHKTKTVFLTRTAITNKHKLVKTRIEMKWKWPSKNYYNIKWKKIKFLSFIDVFCCCNNNAMKINNILNSLLRSKVTTSCSNNRIQKHWRRHP